MGYTPRTVILGEGPHATFNVVAEWPGSSLPEQVILVACHLDAFYAGADDNGSAVAAMLETALCSARLPIRPHSALYCF